VIACRHFLFLPFAEKMERKERKGGFSDGRERKRKCCIFRTKVF